MRRDFAAFVLTHGRPDNCITLHALAKAGYTGAVYLVVDNEDPTVQRYRDLFGEDRVVVFDKKAYADMIDEANNFDERKVIVHARNACFDIAERLGYRFFIQLDDDYTDFLLRDFPTTGDGPARGYMTKKLDQVFTAMVEFIETTPALTVAMSQGGDHIGGFSGAKMKRKAMNSFVCRTDRRFWFQGSVNEDVNTYVHLGSTGGLFFTFTAIQLNQKTTQQQAGGMTDVYLNRGTYVKSFYTVLFAPSAVKVSMMTTKYERIHHLIDWNAAVPKIIPEEFRKSRGPECALG